jgi:hypothetical protein
MGTNPSFIESLAGKFMESHDPPSGTTRLPGIKTTAHVTAPRATASQRSHLPFQSCR